MENRFLDLARTGQNAWWRYILSLALILGSWLGGSVVLILLLIIIAPDLQVTPNGQILGVATWLVLTITLASFIPLVISLWLAVRFIHRRPFRSLITPQPHFDWKRAATGFVLFLILGGLASVIEACLYPGRYQFSLNGNEFLVCLPIALVLVPIQTSAEELFLRGYLLQSLGLVVRRPIVPVIVTSLIFMGLHGANPEMGAGTLIMLVYYFSVGLFLAVITVRDNCLELALGMHAATNLFGILVGYKESALPIPSVFMVNTLDAGYGLISFLVMAVIFYAVLFVRPHRPAQPLPNSP